MPFPPPRDGRKGERVYASIEDLQNVVLFLKEYFRERTPDGEALANPYQLVRIVFADGRRWDAATHGLCSRWAMELGGAGAADAAVSDVDDATQYEQTFHCACSGFVSAWSLRINRLEDVEDAGATSDPEKRYLWECVERRLPSGALSAAIPDPSAPLMAAVAALKELARGDRLRYYDYRGGPEYLLDPLDRIEGAFAGRTDSSLVFPGLVAAAPRHVRNLYAAANAARWFLGSMDSRNENLPCNIFEVCGDAFAQLRLQRVRAVRHVLNQI